MAPDTKYKSEKQLNFDRTKWELFFDEHAPVIYGVIKALCPNEEIAMEITADFFREIQRSNELDRMNSISSTYLVRSAHHFTEDQLASRKIEGKESVAIKRFPLLYLICTENISLSEAATRLRLTLNQFKTALQQEFIFLRNSLWGWQTDAESAGIF